MQIATPSFIVTASGCAPPIPPRPGGQRHPTAQRAAEVLAGQLGERLERALQDALRPDVDPRAGGHLAVHRQALALELAEDLPGGPLADEVRVGDQDARRPFVGPEDRHGLARLDEQGLVVGQPAQLPDDRVEGGPRAGRAAGAAVDDEGVGVLGHLRVEVVHEHPEGGFLAPAAAGRARCPAVLGPGGRRAVVVGPRSSSPDSSRRAGRRADAEAVGYPPVVGILAVRRWSSLEPAERERLLARSTAAIFEPALMASIEAIFRDVAERGDAAVLEATARFDGIELGSGADLRVPRARASPLPTPRSSRACSPGSARRSPTAACSTRHRSPRPGTAWRGRSGPASRSASSSRRSRRRPVRAHRQGVVSVGPVPDRDAGRRGRGRADRGPRPADPGRRRSGRPGDAGRRPRAGDHGDVPGQRSGRDRRPGASERPRSRECARSSVRAARP